MRGIVIDGQTRQPLDAVAVSVTEPQTGLTRGVVTNAAGRFNFATPTGTLHFDRLGYERIVKLAADDEQGTVEMWPTTEVLGEFEVVAPKKKRGAAVVLALLLLAALASQRQRRRKGQR